MTTPVTVPLNLVTQLRSGYQNCLIDFYVAQHDAMCPLCHPQDSGVYVDRMVPAESVPWSAFAQECLMNVVRPVVYAVRPTATLMHSWLFPNAVWFLAGW